jgi:glycosyltransferase involved in cell wall biosynthesis
VHYYPQLPRLIQRFAPQILHVDEEPYNFATYLAVAAARRRSIPSLFFTWQNILRRYPPPFRQMEQAVYARVAGALAGSHDAAEVLRAKGYGGLLHVIPQFGVDPDVFAPGAPRDGPFTVGFLNRLIPAKEPLLTLDAFAALGPDAHLLIVGDGPLRDEVARALRDRGLEDRVTMRSRVSSAEMPEVIRGLDALVLPSRTTANWKEQFGRVLVEAMACGVPVVGSDSGEIPQVVGDAGLIVPEGDGRALAGALQRLAGDRSLREELSRRGRRRVLERFTHAQIAQRTLTAYQAAL